MAFKKLITLNREEISLLKLAVLFEGILAIIFVVEKLLNKSFHFFLPGFDEVLFALLLSQLLFIFNALLVRTSFKRNWTVFQDFIREMIYPLASQLGVFSALVISLFAGVGEELFFRGFLQPKIGIVSTSIIFGLVHFIFNLRRFYLVALLYIAIGFLFGFVYELFDSLWAPVIFHCVYDFTALIYFRGRQRAEISRARP